MKVCYKKQFSKDLDRLPGNGIIHVEIAAVIRAVKAATDLSEVANIKKLKGYKTAYRIRVGVYRLG